MYPEDLPIRQHARYGGNRLDTLSDVLTLMRLRSCVYFLREFAAPWGMEMPDGPYAQFHMVARGRCWLKFGGSTVELAGGDVALFPRGEGHILLDDPASAVAPGRAVLEAQNCGEPMFAEGGERARLLCGHFEFDRAFKHPLATELPRFIHVKALSYDQPDWFEAVSGLLIRETGAEHPGASTVVDRLAEVLFIQVLRAYLLQSKPSHGFLGALCDAQVNRALKAIHKGFGGALSLAAIAREAGMSRSNLALRFREVLGETPMLYATRYRLLKAQELLNASSRTLSEVAERVGYKSESAFSQAFKRQFGQGPGAFRRLATNDAEPPAGGAARISA